MEEKVKKIIEKVRPYINMHGGDLSLVDINEGVVKIKIAGACVGCQLADETFNGMLGSLIREECSEVKDLIIEN